MTPEGYRIRPHLRRGTQFPLRPENRGKRSGIPQDVKIILVDGEPVLKPETKPQEAESKKED